MNVTKKIRTILEIGAVPIVLVGDDSIPIPFFRAYQDYGQCTVIQVDAHIDWRHEVNGITEGPGSTMRRASEMPWIDRLIQVGMRGVGSARTEEVEAAKVYVHGFDLVEFVPEKDTNGLAALTAVRIVFNMIGSLVRSMPFAQRKALG